MSALCWENLDERFCVGRICMSALCWENLAERFCVGRIWMSGSVLGESG